MSRDDDPAPELSDAGTWAIHGRTRTATRTVQISRHAFHTTLTLSRTLAAARSAIVTASYGGDRDTSAQKRSATLRVAH